MMLQFNITRCCATISFLNFLLHMFFFCDVWSIFDFYKKKKKKQNVAQLHLQVTPVVRTIYSGGGWGHARARSSKNTVRK